MAIRPKGTKWQVDVSIAGVRAPRVSCDTKAQAEIVEADFKAKLLAGVPPDKLTVPEAPKADLKGTLGDACNMAHRTFWAGRKAEFSCLRNAEAWCKELGYDFPLVKMDADQIGAVCDAWGANGSAAGTINRKLAALSVMLKLAVERDLIVRVPRLPKRKEYEGRLRWFSDDEVDSLFAHVAHDQEFLDLFIIAAETGLRQAEILTLTKRDIDFKGGLVLLGETKGNKRRSVPLTSLATHAAKRRGDGKMDHEDLFTKRASTTNISRTMRAWKFKIGLPEGDEACFHTFRHTTCSRLVQRGVSLPVVQKFMGHADITTTMRYAHLAPDSLDEARKALEGNPK